MSETHKSRVHVLCGRPGPARAQALDALLRILPETSRVVAVLEGMPADGVPETALIHSQTEPIATHVLAAGCPCCSGALALRVTLARIVQREQPDEIVIGLIDAAHVGDLKRLLTGPSWQGHLEWTGEPALTEPVSGLK
jgi:G3E family GTPase